MKSCKVKNSNCAGIFGLKLYNTHRMSSAELRETNYIESPLLYFKIGVIGCLPLGFSEELAQNFDAIRVSTDLHRLAYINTHSDVIEKDDLVGYINRPVTFRSKLLRQTDELIRQNNDVIVDDFFNYPDSRRPLKEVSLSTGALMVALNVTTSLGVIYDRLYTWIGRGDFELPITYRKVLPVLEAKRSLQNISKRQRPSGRNNEGVHHIIDLDGNNEVHELLNQVRDYLIDQDLC